MIFEQFIAFWFVGRAFVLCAGHHRHWSEQCRISMKAAVDFLGAKEWDALHPWFLGCRRTVLFTHELQELWITSLAPWPGKVLPPGPMMKGIHWTLSYSSWHMLGTYACQEAELISRGAGGKRSWYIMILQRSKKATGIHAAMPNNSNDTEHRYLIIIVQPWYGPWTVVLANNWQL